MTSTSTSTSKKITKSIKYIDSTTFEIELISDFVDKWIGFAVIDKNYQTIVYSDSFYSAQSGDSLTKQFKTAKTYIDETPLIVSSFLCKSNAKVKNYLNALVATTTKITALKTVHPIYAMVYKDFTSFYNSSQNEHKILVLSDDGSSTTIRVPGQSSKIIRVVTSSFKIYDDNGKLHKISWHDLQDSSYIPVNNKNEIILHQQSYEQSSWIKAHRITTTIFFAGNYVKTQSGQHFFKSNNLVKQLQNRMTHGKISGVFLPIIHLEKRTIYTTLTLLPESEFEIP